MTEAECYEVAERLGGLLKLIRDVPCDYIVEWSYVGVTRYVYARTSLAWALRYGVSDIARDAKRFTSDGHIDLTGLPEQAPAPPAIPAGLTVPQWAMLARMGRWTHPLQMNYLYPSEDDLLKQLQRAGLTEYNEYAREWSLTSDGRALAGDCLFAQTAPEPLPYSDAEIAGLLFWGIRADVCSAAQLRGLLDDRKEMTDLGKRVLPEALHRLNCEPKTAPVETAPALEPTPEPALTDAEKALLIDLRKRGGALRYDEMTTEQAYTLGRLAGSWHLTYNVHSSEWTLTDKGRAKVAELVPGLSDEDTAKLRYVRDCRPYMIHDTNALYERRLIECDGPKWRITDTGRDALAIYDVDRANGGA
jgi:hypothetical protein